MFNIYFLIKKKRKTFQNINFFMGCVAFESKHTFTGFYLDALDTIELVFAYHISFISIVNTINIFQCLFTGCCHFNALNRLIFNRFPYASNVADFQTASRDDQMTITDSMALQSFNHLRLLNLCRLR